MKVYYPGPGQKTYHPKLGKLITGDVLELPDEQAKEYVKAGLLKEVSRVASSESRDKEKKKTAGKPSPPMPGS